MISPRTATGRKNLEAASGTVLLLFLVEHLVGNSMLLLSDPEPYRWYTSTLGRSIVVRILEIGLFLLFATHIGIGLMMRLHHMRLVKKKPNYPKPKSISTRFVGYTGAVILVFMVVHLWRFFLPHRVLNEANFDLYTQAHIAFSSVWYTLFYVASMIALASHLKHGIVSAVFSMKFVPRTAIPKLKKVLSIV